MRLKVLVCMFVVVVSFLAAGSIYAGNGDGSGSGSKSGSGNGGGEAQLALESSNPAAGDKDVAIDKTIDLVFSNNVVNMKVAENNKSRFKLVDSNNNEVPIEVIIGDDQVDPTIKNNISIKPMSSLIENETYKLIIDKKVQAKNDSVLAKEIIIDFQTTGGQNSSTLFIGLGILAVALVIVAVGFLKKKKGKIQI